MKSNETVSGLAQYDRQEASQALSASERGTDLERSYANERFKQKTKQTLGHEWRYELIRSMSVTGRVEAAEAGEKASESK